MVTLWNGEPISVTAAELRSNSRLPTPIRASRGDTAQGATKPATLSTGATVKVPLFVSIGDVLRIDTRTGEYVSRVKS